MNVWTWLRKLRERWLRPRIVVLREKEMSEAELNEALGQLPSHPILRAINQILDTGERNAWQDAATNASEPHLVAGYVGAADTFRILRDDLERRRRMGRVGK